MAGKAAEEDDLFTLAAKGGTVEAEAGIPDGGIFLGAGGQGRVNDPGFETRVKPPTEKAGSDKAAKVERPKMPRGSAIEKQAADIAETLEEKFAVIFGLLSGIAPVTGTYGTENAPKAINALLDIGKRRPAVMKALLKLADGADGLELGKFLVGIVVAFQVDMGRLTGTELPARAFGVTEVLEKYFMPEEGMPNQAVTEQVVSNAPRFAPV